MKFFRPYARAALLAALMLVPTAAAQTSRQWFEGGATPLRYEISITPDIERAAFSGETRITIENGETLSTITMNALDLDVASANIDGQLTAAIVDNEAQTLTLTPRQPLPPGRHAITIVYSGRIYDDAYGLFRVAYDQNGQQRRALATQFEVGDARRLAPMWDQPNRRAVFSITMTAPSALMAISNMPVAEATRLPGIPLDEVRFWRSNPANPLRRHAIHGQLSAVPRARRLRAHHRRR